MPSCLFGANRHVPLRRVALGTISAGSDNRPSGDQHTRAGDNSLLDRLTQANVCVSSPFGAEVSNRRKSGQKRVAKVVGGARNTQAQGFVGQLVVPGRLGVRMQQDVGMGLN